MLKISLDLLFKFLNTNVWNGWYLYILVKLCHRFYVTEQWEALMNIQCWKLPVLALRDSSVSYTRLQLFKTPELLTNHWKYKQRLHVNAWYFFIMIYFFLKTWHYHKWKHNKHHLMYIFIFFFSNSQS